MTYSDYSQSFCFPLLTKHQSAYIRIFERYKHIKSRRSPEVAGPDRSRRGSTHLQSSSVGPQSSLQPLLRLGQGWPWIGGLLSGSLGILHRWKNQLPHLSNLPRVSLPNRPMVEWHCGFHHWNFAADWMLIVIFRAKLASWGIPGSQTKPYLRMDAWHNRYHLCW